MNEKIKKMENVCEELNIEMDFLEVLIDEMEGDLDDIEELEYMARDCYYYMFLTQDEIEYLSINNKVIETRNGNHVVICI